MILDLKYNSILLYVCSGIAGGYLILPMEMINECLFPGRMDRVELSTYEDVEVQLETVKIVII